MQSISLVLYDLDGTLVDTAPDLIATLNTLLDNYGLKPVDFNHYRNLVSTGASALLTASFDSTYDFAQLRREFLTIYANNIAQKSRLFSGVKTSLDRLLGLGIPWGIVTNKPIELTHSLISQLDFGSQAICVVGGDSIENRKPSADPLIYACGIAKIDPAHTVYVGDSQTDMMSARAARCFAIACRYGYTGEDSSIDDWDADAVIDNPEELFLQVQSWLIPA